MQCWMPSERTGLDVCFWSWARDAQQSPQAPLVSAQPATAPAGSSQSTAGFLTMTHLPWQLEEVWHGSQIYWLCVSSGVSFLFWEFPTGEVPLLFGVELRSQPLGLSTLGEGFGKGTCFLLFLGLFDFINNQVTSKILVFTLWLNFPQGCLHVCVIPFVFIIPTAVVTHTFSANAEQKAAPFAVSLWSNCRVDSRGHRECLGGTRKPWDNIAWATVVRPLQTMIIRVCLMLIKEAARVYVKNWILYLHAAGVCIFGGTIVGTCS